MCWSVMREQSRAVVLGHTTSAAVNTPRRWGVRGGAEHPAHLRVVHLHNVKGGGSIQTPNGIQLAFQNRHTTIHPCMPDAHHMTSGEGTHHANQSVSRLPGDRIANITSD